MHAHGAHGAVLAGHKLQRRDQRHDLDALGLGVVQLGTTSGHLFLGAAIRDDRVLGAQALGGAHGVHGHVAAAKDHDVLAVLGGGVVLGEVVGLHEVHAGEVLVGKEHVGEVLAGHVEELGQAGAGGHVNGIEALLKQLLGVGDVANYSVVLKLDAHRLKAIDLALDNGLGQTELGDAVDQHAAAGEERLEDGDVKAVAGQLAGAGDAGGAGAHDGDLLAVLGLHDGGGGKLGLVAHKALQLADGHRLALLAANALALALVLLRAHAAADGGQHGLLADDVQGAAVVLGANLLDELGDVDVDGTALDAEGALAVHATLGLCQSHLLGEALVDGAEVAGALGGRLFVVGGARRLHVGDKATVYLWHAQFASS